jgi:uncharacterized protein (DUF3084 family)
MSADEQTKNPDQALADRDERIRERAYQLWEMEGGPEGREGEYWKRAEELIQDETRSAYPPSASRGNRT